ncbi:hypothetical protein ACEWY4_010289 [Coilia grayii]|uniref:Endonuclease/exonuclease/phosphatase domain-containing protein n=1 Tax=Coilia grayii TaxID=363190 RepID=A0ABD1K1H5_9TELE
MWWWIMMALSILQWNGRSLIANGQELKYFVEKQHDKPNIICVQETWLKPSLDFRIFGYTAIRKDREAGAGGGVAMFIHQGLSYKSLCLNTEIEVIGTEVWAGDLKFEVVNFYNPCLKITRELLGEICRQGSSRLILCGDFNAHNTLWGSSRTIDNGRVIEEFMDDCKLVCMNDGRGTRFDVLRGVESAIDLTIVSEQVAGTTQWEVLKTSLESDHFPIWVKINSNNVHLEDYLHPRWNMREANWGLYSMKADVKFMGVLSHAGNDVEELNSVITNIICDTAEETIGKSTGNRQKKMVPWWTNECKEAVKARNKAFKKIKSNHSFDNLIAYKQAQSKARRIIKDTKKKYWRDFCGTIGSHTKIEDVWGMIRKMGGIRRDFSLPVLKDSVCEAVTNVEKAEMLAAAFVKVHSSHNLSNGELEWRKQVIQGNVDLLGRKEVSDNALDKDFTLFELKRALIGAKHTSPGKDGVCYKLIEQLCDMSKSVILKLYNMVWEQGQLPSSWKHSIIVPIPKPGKDKTEAKSYRPIALTSNLCKLMERMLTKRLVHEIEKRGLLSPHQSGFRNGRTAMDPIGVGLPG